MASKNNPLGDFNHKNRRGSFRMIGPRLLAAQALAVGYTIKEAARYAKVDPATVSRWLNRDEFNVALYEYSQEFVEAFWARVPVIQPGTEEHAFALHLVESSPFVEVPEPTEREVKRNRATRAMSRELNRAIPGLNLTA